MRLRKIQRIDVNAIKKAGLRALVASEPGTGKTLVAIRSLVETPWALPAVVVSPASVTFNWKKEFKKWAPEVRVHVIEDTSTPLPKLRPDVYILSWGLLDLWEERLRRRKIKSIVADEAHFSKNPEAIRSQALYRITRNRPGLICLTGTPILNKEQELQTLKDLYGHEPLMIRRLLREVAPDVPEKRRSYLRVQLRPRHKEVYDQANNDFEEWLTKQKEKAGEELPGEIIAEAFVKIGYLRRIVAEAKVPAASDWIARMVRLGEPVIVFGEHSVPLKKLSRSLRKQRIRHCLLDGSTSPRKRQQMVDEFQAYKFPVFLTSKAGKEGITLTAARHVLFLERYFTSAEEEQAEDRCIAEGQLVHTSAGLVPIERVKVGDMVYSHRGRWCRVVETHTSTVKARGFHQSPKRPLITEIDYFRFNQPLICTYDHQLLVLTHESWLSGSDTPQWIQAWDVRPQDFLCLPIPTVSHDLEWLEIPDSVRHDPIFTNNFGVRQRNGRYVPLPDRIQVDEDTLFLFGWYLAEGFTSIEKSKGRFVSLSGHIQERPVLERLARIIARWGVKSTIYESKRTKSAELRAFSVELANLMRSLFGTPKCSGKGSSAESKDVPLWILDLPKEKLRVLWEAYVRGDGYARNNQQEWTTVSPSLASKMLIIATKIGYRPTLRSKACRGRDQWIGCVTRGHEGYSHLKAASQEYVFHPVKSVKTYGDKDRRVYDLSVEGDESFVVGQASVHNCNRIGQRHKTTTWYLHAIDTVDERLDEIVRTKRELIAERLRTNEVEETSEANVKLLLRSWEKHLDTQQKPTRLGLDEPLAPLPRPRDAHSVVFSGRRWNEESARLWCQMNGYTSNKKRDFGDRFHLVIHPASWFHPHSFSAVAISRDIRVLVGERIHVAQEKIARRGVPLLR